jgi:hypothetical protein
MFSKASPFPNFKTLEKVFKHFQVGNLSVSVCSESAGVAAIQTSKVFDNLGGISSD